MEGVERRREEGVCIFFIYLGLVWVHGHKRTLDKCVKRRHAVNMVGWMIDANEKTNGKKIWSVRF